MLVNDAVMPTEQTSKYVAAHGCHFIVCSLCFLIVVINNFALRAARTALYKTGRVVLSSFFTKNFMCFLWLTFLTLTFVRAAGEAGDDGYEFGGVDGFGEVKLEAGAKDAHAVFGTCIRCESGGRNLSTTLRWERADL